MYMSHNLIPQDYSQHPSFWGGKWRNKEVPVAVSDSPSPLVWLFICLQLIGATSSYQGKFSSKHMRIPGSSKGHKFLSVCKISALRADFLRRTWKWSFFWLVWSILYFAPFGLIFLYFAQNMSIFLGGNSREKGGNSREKGGNSRPDSTWLKNEKMKCQFFLEMVIFILKLRNLKKMDRNQTKICPGQKFVTNEYSGILFAVTLSPGVCKFALWNASKFSE